MSDTQDRAVMIRALDAWLEIATCESWLAMFGPSDETINHQLTADQANREAARIAARLRAMEESQ